MWPWLRVPFYGTWHLAFGEGWFRRGLRMLARAGVPLNYHFHAVELLGFEEDAIDSRFACHPGMHLALADKTALVRHSLRSMCSHYRLMPTLELADEVTSRRLVRQASA